jgi:hypothetical protein
VVLAGDQQLVEDLKTAAALLREAPPDLAWDIDFVSQALNAAARHGSDYANAAGNSLLAAFINASNPGTLGQPVTEGAGQRDRLARILDQTPQGSAEEEFYQSLARWTDSLMKLGQQIDNVTG